MMTSNSKATPGWAVELNGDKLDLDVFREMLTPPFDPFVEGYNESATSALLLLRREAWVNFSDGASVGMDANHLVAQLNGAALLLYPDASPIQVGRVLKFKDDGTRENVIISGSITIRLKGVRARGRAGSIVSPPPAETKMQRWVREAADDSNQAELLNHLARAANWYELYKVMELAGLKFGHLKKLLGANYKKWERVRHTANYELRHAPGKVQKPRRPVPWDEARQFVIRQVSNLL